MESSHSSPYKFLPRHVTCCLLRLRAIRLHPASQNQLPEWQIRSHNVPGCRTSASEAQLPSQNARSTLRVFQTGNILQNSDFSENVRPVDYKQHSHRETSARYCRFPRYPPLDCPPQNAASALFPLSDNPDNADTHSRGNRPSGCQLVQ